MYDFDQILDYIRNTEYNGKPIVDDPVVRQDIAQIATELEVNRLYGLRVACMLNRGNVPTYEAAMAKMFGSEMEYRMINIWMKLLSLYGPLDVGSKYAVRDGRPFQRYSVGATRDLLTRGTSEIMRNIIATLGLDLPRE